MGNDDLTVYRLWLRKAKKADRNQDTQFVQDSFAENLQNTPAYQDDARVNGQSQPMLATRKGTKKCKFTLVPGDDIHIGDLVEVFNEHWLCIELYIDEYGMKYGELWMCNQIFRYQDHALRTIEKYAILDDGSYTSGTDKPLLVTDNSFNCYISLDDESRALFVDKRLAIGVVYNSVGEPILEVGKIKWIDAKSRNFGEGSHLMLFGINDDAYNPETDNLDELICDYRTTEEPSPVEPAPEEIGTLSIEGRTTIRIGSGRTYELKTIDANGETVDNPLEVEWSIEPVIAGVTIAPKDGSCLVTIKEDDNLSGETFTLRCRATGGNYHDGEITVEVT